MSSLAPRERVGVRVGSFPFRLGVRAGKGMDESAHAAWVRLWDEQGRTGKVIGIDHLWEPVRRLYNFRENHLGALLGTVLVTGCHWSDGDDCIEVYSDGEDTCGREIERFGPYSPWAEPDCYH